MRQKGDVKMLKWKAKISKSGDRYFIIIPKALHEMIQQYLHETLTVIIESEKKTEKHSI